MDTKTTIAKFTYRIEERPDGGFVACADDGALETLEGVSREELQKKIEEKLTALVDDQIHQQFKIGGADVRLNLVRKVSTKFQSGNPSPEITTPSATSDSSPRFENSGTFWRVLALLLAIAAMVLYLLKR